jgi:YesN/AraC family two-component response regulator
MMWTEQAISQHLDGKFWAVDYEGQITERSVHVDFIPTYNFKAMKDVMKPDFSAAKPWSQTEMDQLWQLRVEQRQGWTQIIKTLHRGEASCKMKYHKMCVDRGVNQVRTWQSSTYDKLTDEQLDKLRQMVLDRLSLKKIGKAFGVSGDTAGRYVRRMRAELNAMRKAA